MKNPIFKHTKRNFKFFTMLFLLFFMFMLFLIIIFVVSLSKSNNNTLFNMGDSFNNYDGDYISAGISEEILRYEKYFKKYADKYFISDQIDVLMALSMQESGGRYLDVMQSSESIGLLPNSITDPEKSIKLGVEYFSKVYKKADGDVKLALQSYNFGSGFIDYAKKRGGYTKNVTVEFSRMKAKELGWSSYGDIDYVEHVMRYLQTDESIPNNPKGKWNYPLPRMIVASEFGYRLHPIYQKMKLHAGIDLSCSMGDRISSVKEGQVVGATHGVTGYGNYVTVKHASNEYSRYAHLSEISVKIGDKLKAGARIGSCGSTGDSTGSHLHLEHMIDMEYKDSNFRDPRGILGLK